MGLVRGAKLGPYEVLDPLGAGGMGEVYKARDTRLDRTVAIKVLPAKLAAHPEARQRMEREARAVSSLNHPHICTLYDIGHDAGIDFLVLEYLEGETLAERLKKGPLPVDGALRYATEVAGALDRAHRAGIVHRDLKPGNIMLTKSGTKLLDFGLAKIRESVKASEGDATAALTRDLTSPGAIVGTFQYMSPEQVEAREADARSDIFSFGTVLYEMVAGQKAFQARSPASLIAAILTAEPPPVSAVQAVAPAALDRVIRACLAKDPDERWQSAGDLARELKWIAESGGSSGPQAQAVDKRGRGGMVPWIVAAAAIVAALPVFWRHFRETPQQQPSIRFTVPTEARLPAQVKISPDGTKIAFIGQNAQGKVVLWVRALDKSTAVALAGTEGAYFPFWSPDSRQIAFLDAYDHVRRIDAGGGQSQIICDAKTAWGGSWSKDGTIVFGTANGIVRVPASGGTPLQITTPDPSQHSNHFYPTFLPDGRHFLYLNSPQMLHARMDTAPSLYLTDIGGKEAKPVIATALNGLYSPAAPGHLLFVRDGALMAQEMDSASGQLKGEPVRLEDSVSIDVPHVVGDFSVSNNGVLALNVEPHQHELVWVDRAGNRLSAPIPVTEFAHPRLSPDGKLAVYEDTDLKAMTTKVWQLDVDRAEVSLFDNGGNQPLFFPDGKSVLFGCDIENKIGFCRKPTGGAGRTEMLWESGPGRNPVDISPDGRFLSFTAQNRGTRELWILPLTGERKPYAFYPTHSRVRHGVFSPDGKWIVYECDETGDHEVYVQPFPATGAKHKISTHGGSEPRWRGDGKELFYRTEDGKVMAVSIQTAGGFQSGQPKMLFQSSADPLYPSIAVPYTAAKDGQRFLMNVAKDETRNSPLTVITNWTAALRR